MQKLTCSLVIIFLICSPHHYLQTADFTTPQNPYQLTDDHANNFCDHNTHHDQHTPPDSDGVYKRYLF